MKHKSWFIVLLLILALIVVACGGAAPAAPTEEAAVPAEPEVVEEAPMEEPTAVPEVAEDISAEADAGGIEPIRIAIVMPSTISDLAWSQAMYDSLLRIQESAGGADVVEIAYTENMFNVTDAAAAIRDYAADGYNLVMAHGTQYGTSLFEIAPDFPETSFAWGTAVDTGSELGLTNVFAYEARAEEGGYVNGVLAANISESGILGVVGPVEAGDARTVFAAPAHPYTAALMSATPSADPDRKKARIMLTGELPSPLNPPPGCAFNPRCPLAFDRCRVEVPELEPRGQSLVACFAVEE